MHLGGKHAPWMQRVAVAGGPLSPASVLCYLPGALSPSAVAAAAEAGGAAQPQAQLEEGSVDSGKCWCVYVCVGL
jgi:hypothetical protein